MKEGLKYFAAGIMRALIRIPAAFLQVNKKQILFDAHHGRQYSCNPRAVYEGLLEQGRDFEYVWVFRDPESCAAHMPRDPHTRVCRYRSLKHLYYFLTSRYVIFNAYLPAEMPVRKGQILIDTWHGGGSYKKVGLENGNTLIHTLQIRQKIKGISVFLSSSEYFSEEVVRKQFGFRGRIFKIGMPRNDSLFDAERMARMSEHIRELYRIPRENFVILYAPTYRGDHAEPFEPMDIDRLRAAAEKRFGREVTVLYRGHHLMAGQLNGADLDVTDYFDMQDLLAATDMLISDYSSSIWDYSFTGRPCLLYTPDLETYRRERGFDKEIEEWGFPVCESNDVLEQSVLKFDETAYRKAMEHHHSDLRSYEKGHATEELIRKLK